MLCWEFGNEFEGWADSANEVKLPWHIEMSDYLTSIDPWVALNQAFPLSVCRISYTGHPIFTNATILVHPVSRIPSR